MTVGRISGSDYVEASLFTSPRHTEKKKDWSKSEDELAKLKQAYCGAVALRVAAVETDVSGHAVNFDAAAITEAAFGNN